MEIVEIIELPLAVGDDEAEAEMLAEAPMSESEDGGEMDESDLDGGDLDGGEMDGGANSASIGSL